MEPDVIEELDALLMKLTPEQVQVFEERLREGHIHGWWYGNINQGCGCAYGTAFYAVTGRLACGEETFKQYEINQVLGTSLTLAGVTPLESYLCSEGEIRPDSDFHKAVLAHMDGRGIIPKETN